MDDSSPDKPVGVRHRIIGAITPKRTPGVTRQEQIKGWTKRNRIPILLFLGVAIFVGVMAIFWTISTDERSRGPRGPIKEGQKLGDGKTVINIQNHCRMPIWLNVEKDGLPAYAFIPADGKDPSRVYKFPVDSSWKGRITANYREPDANYRDTQTRIDFKSEIKDGVQTITYYNDAENHLALPLVAEAVKHDGKTLCSAAGCVAKRMEILESCPAIGEGDERVRLIGADGQKCISPSAFCSDKANFDRFGWCRDYFTEAINYCATAKGSGDKLVHPHCIEALHPSEVDRVVANSTNVFVCASDPKVKERDLPFASNILFSGAVPAGQAAVPPDQGGGEYLCAAIQRGIIDNPGASESDFYPSQGKFPSNPWARWIHQMDCPNTRAFAFDGIPGGHGKGDPINQVVCSDAGGINVTFCPAD